MSSRPAIEWRGRRRGLVRVMLLFAVTAGGFWPIWLAQILPSRRRVAIAVAAVVPGLNVVVEVLLALLVPRAVRRLAEERPAATVPAAEVQAFLLLAAPSAAIALTLALGLPAWVVGYLAWPLELPAALAVQRALNRLTDQAPMSPSRARLDGEVLASGAIAAAIAAAAVLVIVLGGDEQERAVKPTGAPQAAQVSDVAATPGALWVTRIADNEVEQLDPVTTRPTGKRVRVGRSPYDIAAGYGDLWVADYRSDSVSRIDPRTARVKGGLIPTGRGPFGVAVGYGAVWVTNEVDRNLVQIDPGTGRVRRKVTVGLGPRGVDVGEGAVWVAGASSMSVVRVDPRSGATRRIQMPGLCQDVAVGGGSVWAAIPQVSSVIRLDPRRGRRVGGPISVGPGPASIDYGDGSVWVANGDDGTVTRIDARTGRVVGRPRLIGDRLTDLTVSGRNVWVLRADGVVRRITAR
jgi:YVTN family beta-propeller protein